MSLDTNPDYIGCSILDKANNDKGYNVVHTFGYDLKENNKSLPKEYTTIDRTHHNYKRKHGITHIWKDIFEVFTYYNCAYLVVEDLNVNKKDLGNVVANRKVNNVWYRELSNKLINKFCNRLGIIKIEINPIYSSFIGNLMNNYIDPVNAAIEIGRRGIYKYEIGKFYPAIEMGTILNTMSRLNSDIEVRDVLVLKDQVSWQGIFGEVKKTGLRYRLMLDDLEMGYKTLNKLLHSNVTKHCFNEGLIKIPNYA